MSDKAYVSVLPTCDIHEYEKGVKGVEAQYDGKTVRGPWANMCEDCFQSHGIGLGTGRGQRLIVGEKPEESKSDKRSALLAAIESGDFDAAEDIVGDGDIAEYL